MINSKRKNLIITLAALFLAFLTAFWGSLLITPNKKAYAVDESGNPTSSDVFFAAPRVEVDDVEHITFRLCVSWEFINSCNTAPTYQFYVSDKEATITNETYIENGNTYYGVDLSVAFTDVNQQIRMYCKVTYDNKTYTTWSSSCSAIDLWRAALNENTLASWSDDARQYVTQKVEDEYVNYTALQYTPYSSIGFDEDYIVKIYCINIDEHLSEDELYDYAGDYVTQITFRAASGYQIYFNKEGRARSVEDITSPNWFNYTVIDFSKYYDILHFDEEENAVYITFQNLDEIEDEYGSLSNCKVFLDDSTYVKPPEVALKSAIPVEINENDIDLYIGTEDSVDSERFDFKVTLTIQPEVLAAINNINLTCSSDLFALDKSSFTVDDAVSSDGAYIIETYARGNISAYNTPLKVSSTINYSGNQTFNCNSATSTLLGSWQYDILAGLTKDETQTQLINSYNAGFLEEVEGMQNYFAAYTGSNDLAITSTVFKITVGDASSIGWSVDYYQGDSYDVCVRVDTHGKIWAEVYTVFRDVLESASKHNTSYEALLIQRVQYIVSDGYYYIRFMESAETLANNFIPSKATKYFRAYNYSDGSIQVNSATIIYDEYNAALTDEIDALKARVAELEASILATERKMADKNKAISELEVLIAAREDTIVELEDEIAKLELANNALNGNMAKLSADLEKARAELATLKEEKAALETALEGDNAELISLLRSREAEITRLNNEIKKLQDENENLKQQIKAQGNFVGCGSIDTRNGAGGSGAATSILLPTALGLALFYIGVQYARKKNKTV